jgi:hypothetical protein
MGIWHRLSAGARLRPYRDQAVSIDVAFELLGIAEAFPSHASSVGEWGDLSNGVEDAAIAGVVVRDALLPSSASSAENPPALPGQ